MSVYFTGMSVFGAVVSILILGWYTKEGEFGEVKKYIAIGLFAVIFDFIVEYMGTSTGNWTYHSSVFFIADLVPVELVLLFFGAGVGARFGYLQLKKFDISMGYNKILYLMMAVAFGYYIIGYNSGPTLLPFAAAFGIWGLCNTSESNRNLAVFIAILAFFADIVAEVISIGSGAYTYINGLSLSVPVIYSFMALGLVGLVEKLEQTN